MKRWTRAFVGFALGFVGTVAAIGATEVASDEQRLARADADDDVGVTLDVVAHCEATWGGGTLAVLLGGERSGWRCAVELEDGQRFEEIDAGVACSTQLGEQATAVADDGASAGWRCVVTERPPDD